MNHEFKDMGGSCKEQGKGVGKLQKLHRKIIIKKKLHTEKNFKNHRVILTAVLKGTP